MNYEDLAFKPELTWEELCKCVENTAAVSNDSFYKDGLTFYNCGTVFAGDIETINNFVGEKIINEVDEEKASSLDSDTFKFFEKLAHKIVNTKGCSRNCFFRKVGGK